MGNTKSLFATKLTDTKLCESFKNLRDRDCYLPAKEILEEKYLSFIDKDEELKSSFQTDNTSFNASLWELYLNCLFDECGFAIERRGKYPDFNLQKNEIEICVEAVTTQSNTKDDTIQSLIDKNIDNHNVESKKAAQAKVIHHYTLKVSNSLKKKLNKDYTGKKYWQHDWSKGKPFVFAVTLHHTSISQFLSDWKIIEYLYGANPDGSPQSDPIKFVYETKQMVVDYFFKLPESENVSAILFSNNADLDKFNRMGFQKEYSREKVVITRSVGFHNHTSGLIDEVDYLVGSSAYFEPWSEGTSIFHNPNAKYKIDDSLFDGVRQLRLANGMFQDSLPKYYSYQSLTHSVCTKDFQKLVTMNQLSKNIN